MSHQLSAGALLKMYQGEEVTDPVLQVLGYKPIQGRGKERSAEKLIAKQVGLHLYHQHSMMSMHMNFRWQCALKVTIRTHLDNVLYLSC